MPCQKSTIAATVIQLQYSYSNNQLSAATANAHAVDTVQMTYIAYPVTVITLMQYDPIPDFK